MSAAVAQFNSTMSLGPNDHQRGDAEAGPRGFTAVNTNMPSPPRSRGTHEPRAAREVTNGGPETSAESHERRSRQEDHNVDRHSNIRHAYADNHVATQQKRRRSDSSDGVPLSPPHRYDHHPPKKADIQQQQHLADRALHVLDETNHQQQHNFYSATPTTQNMPGYNYSRPYAPVTNSAHSSPPVPEGQHADEYSREPSEQHYASSANGQEPDKLEDGGAGKHSPLQHGQKRKRNFSNRTKTGCVTCRRRKKKCDEGRPICNNCQRGNFTCEGYQTNASTRAPNWVKTPSQKDPVPLQAKDVDDVYDGDETPVMSQAPGFDGPQMRHHAAIDGQEHARQHYTSHPAALTEPRPSYSGQPQHNNAWNVNQNQQHHPRQLQSHSPQNSYPPDQLPPLNEAGRAESVQHNPRTPYSAHPQGSMSRPPSHQSHPSGPPPAAPSQWQQHGPPPPQTQPPQTPVSQPQPQPHYQPPPPPQQDYAPRPPYPPRINTTQPQYGQDAGKMHTANTANTATTASAAYSSYEAKPGSRVFLNEDVERSKMLRGAPYNYFDTTLKGERQRCANALLRYNNACQLGSGISENETQAMLHKVFDPKLDTTFNSPVAPRIDGHLGPGVKIEPGFRCTYGYNIRIFDNVFVGENTRVDDSGKVDIGARTWVGANVTILTNDVAKDMTVRKGTDGQQCMARPVTIGPEVVVGTGAVILPGVKIGRGATIEPFAHVRSDLADFATQRGPQVPPGTGPF